MPRWDGLIHIYRQVVEASNRGTVALFYCGTRSNGASHDGPKEISTCDACVLAYAAAPGQLALTERPEAAMQGPEGVRLGSPQSEKPVSCAGPHRGASKLDQHQPLASRASESGDR